MDRNYWDTIASDYDGEIFDVRASDKNRVIEKRLLSLSKGRGKAIDFGCGTGKFLPFLADHFPEVRGYDLSSRLVKQAASAYHYLTNVKVETENLAKPVHSIAKGDLGLCVNVLITHSQPIRSGILKTISRSLKKGAPLLLVVPSLESVLLSSYRLIDWNLKDGDSYRKAVGRPGHLVRVAEGLVDIDAVPTKHYLKEELEHWLPRYGFKVHGVRKVEYEWNTEFERPSSHMKAPYPWDWLVEAERS